jgi:non-specific serine/threonine protein kinase
MTASGSGVSGEWYAGNPSGRLPSIVSTPLLGRERELGQVLRLVRRDEVRFVTVAGPPGAGKTRLGLAVAERARAHFPNGVYLVDLTTSSEPRGVAPAIAHVVGTGTTGQAPEDVAAALRRALRDQRALIVLDNFEGVLQAAAMLVEMLAACPGLTLLTTSRESARAAIEEVFFLPPLATPDLEDLPGLTELRRVPSLALFEARARAVRPDWRLSEANARLIAEACVRLDGLPLAIELAAAWMRALSPEQLLDRLSLHFLATGDRGVPERHRTLEAAIGWSHQLLDDDQRILFRRLGVFEGGWTFDACHAICAEPGDSPSETLKRLASLVDKNLVRQLELPDGQVRFGLLETIRAFAREQLERSGELAAVRRRHAEQMVGLVEQAESELDSPAQVRWLERLEAERQNLRAALDWCVVADDPQAAELGLRLVAALWLFWDVRRHVQEGRRPLKAILERPSAAQRTRARARALLSAGWLAYVRGDVPDAEVVLGESLAIAREQGDQLGQARAQAILGTTVATYTLELERSEALLQEAIALAGPLADTWSLGFAFYNLGVIEMKRNRLDRAWAWIEECHTVSGRTGNTFGIACALFRLAWIAALRGETGRAVELQKESVRLNWALRNKRVLALCLEQLAWLDDTSRPAVDRARLFGAADTLMRLVDYELSPLLRVAHDQAVAELSGRLERAALDRVWAEGGDLTMEQVVALALGVETVSAARGGHRSSDGRLSPRQLEVARLVADGLTDREIALRLGISHRTVDSHLRQVSAKLGYSSRTAIAVWALRQETSLAQA